MAYKKVIECILCKKVMLPKHRKHNNMLGYSIPIKTINDDHCNFRQFCLEIRFGYDNPTQNIYRSRMCMQCKQSIVEFVKNRSGLQYYIESRKDINAI